jgi:ArsR family transcriptional regulator
MESKAAISALSALGHEGRLAIFRLLVQAGPEGLPAGEIARRLDMLPNTLSTNLNVLSQTGLLTSQREGRSIIYKAHYAAMGALLNFLIADCCKGAAEVCAPLADIVTSAAACCSTTTAKPPHQAGKKASA